MILWYDRAEGRDGEVPWDGCPLNASRGCYAGGGTQSLKEHILSCLLFQQQGVFRGCLLDREGNIACRYNQYPFPEEFPESRLCPQELSGRRQSGLGTRQPAARWIYAGEWDFERR